MVVVKRTVVDYDVVLERVLKQIKEEKLSISNKRVLNKTYKYLTIKGISKIRISRILSSLLVIARKYELKKLKRDDILDILFEFKQKGYSDDTIEFYLNALRHLSKILNKDLLIDIKIKRNERKDYIDFDTFMNIVSLIPYEDYKIFTLFLYDTGCRPSEALSVSIEDIIDTGNSLICHTIGKTGERELYVVAFYDEIKRYLEKRKRENATYLFDISYDFYTKKILKKVKQTLGLKRLYPYMFRHSRATDLANVLTDQQLKKMFGWTQNSRMLKRYIKREYIEIPVEKLQIKLFDKKCVSVHEKNLFEKST